MTTRSGGWQGRSSLGAPPRLRHLELHVHRGTGRDAPSEYCDVIELRPGRVALVHAEASGRNDVAAQGLVDLRTILHNVLGSGPHDIGRCAFEVNGLLYGSPPRPFVCMFLGIYDDATRSLDYVNCGEGPHPLLRRDGTVERLFVSGIPIGLMSSFPFEPASLSLAPGDTLIVGSGIPEEELEEWAPLEGLRGSWSIRTLDGVPLERIPGELLRGLRSQSPDEQFDDLAMLVARGK